MYVIIIRKCLRDRHHRCRLDEDLDPSERKVAEVVLLLSFWQVSVWFFVLFLVRVVVRVGILGL